MILFQKILHRWSSFTRYLILFVILNGTAINLPILLGTSDITTLHYTGAFFRQEAKNDSWNPMRMALRYLHEPDLRYLFSDKPLYEVLFFDQHVKFLYPLTSLLLLEPFREFSKDGFIRDDTLNTISWIGIILMALLCARIFLLSLERYTNLLQAYSVADKIMVYILLTALTLTFYPIILAYSLGQVQAWINVLFAGILLSWMCNRKKLSGFLAGLICIMKPHFILLLLWGLLRRQKKFTVSLAITVLLFVLISIDIYGLDNNLGYYDTIVFIAHRGETYFHNQSVNGLLNRLLLNGYSLAWLERSYPPYNPYVYWGTLISSLAIICMALFWKYKDYKNSDILDLSLVVLSFTIASPIAWEHHYGILLPIFAVALPATYGLYDLRNRGIMLLAVTFFISSNFFQFTEKIATTYLNFLQSSLFFSALILLFYLYRLRRTVMTCETGLGLE